MRTAIRSASWAADLALPRETRLRNGRVSFYLHDEEEPFMDKRVILNRMRRNPFFVVGSIAAVVHALNGVMLTLNKGESLGLVGESGAGKSVRRS